MSNSSFESSEIIRPAIEISQPLGNFYAFSLRADLLGEITYSQPAEAIARMDREEDNKGGYSIFGTQRGEDRKRLDEIASFIRTTEATFPNSIILAANYDKDGRYIDDEEIKWIVERSSDGLCWIKIPTRERTASIIDGQHRLHAFDRLPADAKERKMELLCVVFLELPVPYHAYVFATINFNQKKVDRSLAYDLFGFDVDERPVEYWSPETLAVYLARLLNTDQGSPFYKCIHPAADTDKIFLGEGKNVANIRVSMATVVDGILRLISRNPKEDRNIVRRPENKERGRGSLRPIDGFPLRGYYLRGNDRALYEILFNYFSAVRSTIWESVGPGSYLRKTVGIQALFDVLKEIVNHRPITAVSFSTASLIELLQPCSLLDPNGDKYQASGIGRSAIRRDLLEALAQR
ncbi:DGQHR domain-containing protein [Betaproteobacteria bacterium SCN1]|jgi:DNA phosphorothioation-associated DGQHR protein 1|nr:DGQHR domain-containing protein [Betaproteobacteria bacterium SCN1]